ncbi:MAG: murein transglycosylase A [Zoogloeaceae bacterium]|nr:murein transglycosylase A [Zoogloeaceae bacterium]
MTTPGQCRPPGYTGACRKAPVYLKPLMTRPFLSLCTPAALIAALFLAACQTASVPERTCPGAPNCPPVTPPPVATPAPPLPTAPLPSAKGLQSAHWADLPGWERDDPLQVLPALRSSCTVLSRQRGWKAACDSVLALGERPAPEAVRGVLMRGFTPWQLVNPDGTREGLITGYYEPLIRGSRVRTSQYAWPIRGVPEDMLTIDFSDVYPDLKKYRLRGRLVGNKVVPYWTRSELERMGDRLPSRVIAWAADPVELFFLQVQGSGRMDLAEGPQIRLAYADQNGQPYQSIGRWLVDRGELTLDAASMEGIKTWARNHPERLTELLNVNPSYVFFKELPASNGGPAGAQGVPLLERRSIAVDPRAVPLGAPVYLATTEPNSDRPWQRLMVAQDTGGAIKGNVRADVFWGFGAEAGALAGRMRQTGRMWALLPKGMAPE